MNTGGGKETNLDLLKLLRLRKVVLNAMEVLTKLILFY